MKQLFFQPISGVILFLLTLLSLPTRATHIVSGELTYQCIGTKKYQFTLVVYSECGSVAILEQDYPIRYFSPSLGISQTEAKTFILKQTAEIEIPIYCNTVVTNCNGGTERGVNKVIYTGIVDLSGYEYAPDWTFYWVRAARSEEITTLLAPDQEDFYIQVEMNSLAAPCNSSPIFTGNPVVTACVGDEKSFNNLAYDANGDALRYSLTTPKSSFEDEVVYLDGFDAETFIPMNAPATINPVTGDISFTPTLQMVGITDVRIEEYRNGELIGASTRGLQVTSIDCSNNPPALSGFDVNNTTQFALCAGDSLSLFITGSDEDVTEELHMSLISGPSNVFDIEDNYSPTPKGTFNWRPSLADTGKHYFTIQLKDDACPKPETITKTFEIEVLSLPTFDLGLGKFLSCNDTVLLAPKISEGDGNYEFDWNTGETNDSIKAIIGTYYLTVTDGNGCATTGFIDFDGNLEAGFSEDKKCLGETTIFTDESISLNSDIISWEWDLGDGTTSTEQNPSHIYPGAGEYLVGLTVTNNDNPACKNSVKKNIVICPPLNLDFTYTDSCSATNIYFIMTSDASSTECEAQLLIWDFGDGTVEYDHILPDRQPKPARHQYETGGEYTVTLTYVARSGCETVVSKKIKINPAPIVDIIEDNYIFNCNEPDSVLHAQLIEGGTGDISFLWIGNSPMADKTTNSLEINSAGSYAVLTKDDLGCTFFDTLQVKYPLKADFVYSPYCEEGDVIQFTDSSTAEGTPITVWEWDFDDGNTSTDQHPDHLYTTHDVYTAKLHVEDGNGCESDREMPVYIKLLNKDEFEVKPDAISICVSDSVFGYGPSIETGGILNYYSWNLGDGRVPSRLDSQQYIRTVYYAPDEYVARLTTKFNKVEGINEGCTRLFLESVVIFPELDIAIDDNRICQDVPVDFSFQRIAGDLSVPVTDAVWDFGDGSATVNELSPSHTYTSFEQFPLTLNVEDANGCRAKVEQPAQVERVAHPDFLFDVICAGEPTPISINFYDTLENITDYFWDFGGEDTLSGLWPAYDTEHLFETGGIYPVTLKVTNVNSRCEQSVTKDIMVLDIPNVAFTADTVCLGDTTTFTNFTTLKTGTITGYKWLFPDGSISTEKDPVKLMSASGELPVQLVVYNSSNCSDTLTKNVVVKAIPEPDFYTDADFLEAFQPIQFFDDSEGEVATHFWDFGDGNTSTEKDPVHTYDSIAIYEVTHIVANDLGCPDTIAKPTSLKVYLELPTAFSPNGDGQNDDLGLIHRGIKELYDFKIYNRWGEMVFDAGTQIDKTWDGTINGKPQKYGVYVVHVKAKAAYDIEFNFKKNVTLLR